VSKVHHPHVRRFLLDVQSHRSVGDPELVEDGPPIAMHVPPGKKICRVPFLFH